MLLSNHLGQLFFGPVLNRVVSIGIAHIKVYRSLLGLAFDGEIVGELALIALGAGALLEEGAQHRLGIGADLKLLRGDRLEQLRQLLLLLQLFLLLLLLDVHILNKVMLSAALHLLFDLRDELLLLGTLFVLQPERLILQSMNRTELENSHFR